MKDLPKLLRDGVVARLEPEKKQGAGALPMRVRAAIAGVYGDRVLQVGEMMELDSKLAMQYVCDGRLVVVQEEPAAVNPESAAEAKKSKQPPRP
jgi:hypothetical protein